MSKRNSIGLPQDPDALVFWLTVMLSALFMLFAPGAPGGIAAL